MIFKGSIVALITPFKKGKVDEKKLSELVEFHVNNRTSAIVPCGSTGESSTLNPAEHNRVIEIVVKAVRGRIPVIAGTGSNSTQEAIELTRHAAKAGADASLQVSPYYNRPTQQGLYMHFKAIAESTDIPLILYNIQSRTAVNIEPETMARLAEIKNIVAVKEASANLDQMSQMMKLCKGKITLLSGDDSLTLPVMSIGGTGVISVVANIVPADTAALVDAFEKGNLKQAREWHYKLLPLVKAMFYETNPIPVKTAMALMKKDTGELRLPLAPMSPANRVRLILALKEYKLL